MSRWKNALLLIVDCCCVAPTRGILSSASLGVCWDVADLDGLASVPYRSDELAIAVHRNTRWRIANACAS